MRPALILLMVAIVAAAVAITVVMVNRDDDDDSANVDGDSISFTNFHAEFTITEEGKRPTDMAVYVKAEVGPAPANELLSFTFELETTGSQRGYAVQQDHIFYFRNQPELENGDRYQLNCKAWGADSLLADAQVVPNKLTLIPSVFGAFCANGENCAAFEFAVYGTQVNLLLVDGVPTKLAGGSVSVDVTSFASNVAQSPFGRFDTSKCQDDETNIPEASAIKAKEQRAQERRLLARKQKLRKKVPEEAPLPAKPKTIREKGTQATVCNGHASHCSKYPWEITVAGSHNAYGHRKPHASLSRSSTTACSTLSEGALGSEPDCYWSANTNSLVYEQLDFGVRGLLLDAYIKDGYGIFTHLTAANGWSYMTTPTGSSNLRHTGVLNEIADWVVNNPDEFITIVVESHMDADPMMLKTEFDKHPALTSRMVFLPYCVGASGNDGKEGSASDPCHCDTTTYSWQTLGQYLTAGKQIVVFVEKRDLTPGYTASGFGGTNLGYHPFNDYSYENNYNYGTIGGMLETSAYTKALNRGKYNFGRECGKWMLMNHFVTNPGLLTTGSFRFHENSGKVNQKRHIVDHANVLIAEHGGSLGTSAAGSGTGKGSIVGVDCPSAGGRNALMQAIDVMNGHTERAYSRPSGTTVDGWCDGERCVPIPGAIPAVDCRCNDCADDHEDTWYYSSWDPNKAEAKCEIWEYYSGAWHHEGDCDTTSGWDDDCSGAP